MQNLKSYLVMRATGGVLILTDHDLAKEPGALKKLAEGGLEKFIAFEVPLEQVKTNYSAHYEHVLKEPKQISEFITLDDDAREIFENISLKGLGAPLIYE